MNFKFNRNTKSDQNEEVRTGFGRVLTILITLFVLTAHAFPQEHPPAKSGTVKKIKELFQKYHREKITLAFIYYELDHMTVDSSKEIRNLLETDMQKLKKRLDTKHLKNKVLPRLRNSFRKKRDQLLTQIRNQNKYNNRRSSRTLEARVARQSLELQDFYHSPLTYYLKEKTDHWKTFFRARTLAGYLNDQQTSGENTPSDNPKKSTEKNTPEIKLLKMINTARAIVHMDSVGNAPSLQPHLDENKNVEAYNQEREKLLTDAEFDLVLHVNRYRKMFGLKKLKIHMKLVRAARAHSLEMKKKSYFSHHSPVEEHRTVSDRLKQEGFTSTRVGENLALGNVPTRQVIREWIRSPDHHRNMLIGDYVFIGPGKEGMYWTLNFGSEQK